MAKSTDELLKQMKNSRSYAEYREANKETFLSVNLAAALAGLLEEKQIKKSEVISRSGLEPHYAYQIFSGEKNPTRDKVLMLCFGFPLSMEETQNLLKTTGYAPLYGKNERDNVILYGLAKELSMDEVNCLLDEMHLGCFYQSDFVEKSE